MFRDVTRICSHLVVKHCRERLYQDKNWYCFCGFRVQCQGPILDNLVDNFSLCRPTGISIFYSCKPVLVAFATFLVYMLFFFSNWTLEQVLKYIKKDNRKVIYNFVSGRTGKDIVKFYWIDCCYNCYLCKNRFISCFAICTYQSYLWYC